MSDQEKEFTSLQAAIQQLANNNAALISRIAHLESEAKKPQPPPQEGLRERIRREREERVKGVREEPKAKAQPDPNFINKDRAEAFKRERNNVEPPRVEQREKRLPNVQFIPLEFYCWIDGAVGVVTIPLQLEPEQLVE
jgi:hypothetical protein